MLAPPRPDPFRIGGSIFETMLRQGPLVIGVAGKNGDSALRVAQCCFEKSAGNSRLRRSTSDIACSRAAGRRGRAVVDALAIDNVHDHPRTLGGNGLDRAWARIPTLGHR